MLVRLVALAFIVALLTFSASGAYALVIAEPCTGDERPGQEDGACPPTCVTCGCCAQAAEPVSLLPETSLEVPITKMVSFVPRVPLTHTREILHVPRLRLA
jgi:hypothetical protein